MIWTPGPPTSQRAAAAAALARRRGVLAPVWRRVQARRRSRRRAAASHSAARSTSGRWPLLLLHCFFLSRRTARQPRHGRCCGLGWAVQAPGVLRALIPDLDGRARCAASSAAPSCCVPPAARPLRCGGTAWGCGGGPGRAAPRGCGRRQAMPAAAGLLAPPLPGTFRAQRSACRRSSGWTHAGAPVRCRQPLGNDSGARACGGAQRMGQHPVFTPQVAGNGMGQHCSKSGCSLGRPSGCCAGQLAACGRQRLPAHPPAPELFVLRSRDHASPSRTAALCV